MVRCKPSLGQLAAAETPPATKGPSEAWIKSITKRHQEFLKIAKAGDVDVLFLGDSITDFWRRGGKAVWAKYFAPLKAANFGIAGDGTRGVLWRIQNGELEGIHPKVVVPLIGTNNSGEKADAIAGGVKDIITGIHKQQSDIRILLHAIFLRDGQPTAGSRPKFVQFNAILATYAKSDNPRRVIYIDIGDKYLNSDKTMNQDLMPDTLHPNEKGYEVWAEAIIDTVRQQRVPGVTPQK